MAIRICPYSNLRDFYNLSFIKWQDNKPQLLEIVVPSPDLADNLREQLKSHKHFQNISVTTISNFVKKNLKALHCPKPVVRKAEILLHFSSIWQKYFKEYDYALFSQAYELFSDWRSYSLEIAHFEEALNALDPVIKKAVLFFWTYMDQMEFLDEHSAYEYLGSHYSHDSHAIHENEILFYGFTHLSGTQIGMIQNIANQTTIYIPIHEKMLNSCQPTDWISWLSEIKREKDKKISIKLNLNTWSTFKRSELNSTLERNTEKCLLLGSQDVVGNLSELHQQGDFFKVSYDFLKTIEKKFFEEFKLHFLDGSFEECKSYLSEVKNIAIESKNWKKLKVIELYEEALSFLSAVTLNFDQFMLSVVRHYVHLNFPRNYVLTINSNVEKQILKSEYLWSPDLSSAIDIVIKGDDTLFKGGTVNYSSQVFKVLASIGPIQRMGFRGDWLKLHLAEIVLLGGTLYLEDSLLETSSFWKEQALASIKDKKRAAKNIESKDYIWNLEPHAFNLEHLPSKVFSPTQLQKYIDCPRSYFVTYEMSFDPKIKNENEILPSDLGNLEHKLIEQYFKTNSDVNEDKLLNLATQLLSEALSSSGKKIQSIDKEVALEELVSYSINVLNKLYELKKLPGFKYEFEKEFINIELSIQGRIDFFYQTDYGNGIIDFKRSKVASYSEVQNGDVIQLWTYLFGMNLNLKNCTLEYFNLSSPEKSWGIGELSQQHMVKLPRGYKPEAESMVHGKLHDLILKIKSDKNFVISPRRANVCQYCLAAQFCPRVERKMEAVEVEK